jgi:hypothetical protein
MPATRSKPAWLAETEKTILREVGGGSVAERLLALREASGQTATIGMHTIERCHVGFWSITPDPAGTPSAVYSLGHILDVLGLHRPQR